MFEDNKKKYVFYTDLSTIFVDIKKYLYKTVIYADILKFNGKYISKCHQFIVYIVILR